MTLPICDDCSKRTILCPNCQRLYDAGQITPLDIEVSRLIAKSVDCPVDVKGAVKTQDQVIIIASQDHVGKVIGESGRSIRAMSEALGMKTKVVGASDFEKIARAMIAPARVRSINKVVGPKGNSIRIRIEKSDISRMRMSPEDLSTVISAACDEPVSMSFD